MDHNDDCSDDMSVKPLLSSDTSYAFGLYGRLEDLSRIGDEYQAKIPQLITDSEYLDYTKNPIEEEKKAGVPNDFLIGLAIPIVWINQEVGNMKKMKREPLSYSNDLKKVAKSLEKNEDRTFDVSLEAKNMKYSDMVGTRNNDQICPVPGCFVESWTEIERASCLLGLYIFEKDFVLLKRFIESKKMGDILSYYYGNFYRSVEYQRWSESRKTRGKRCILGPRIFSGLRQQELLSRLFPNVSQECQNSLLEVSRTFADGRISIIEFVFSLRKTVGLKSLIDAVGIGRGKQDLTGTAIEPTKQNQAIHIRPEIPVGKACSSLTSTEIVKFLTGDYRLSKARSNDLFWEAVWPRLLARGWHSEQPNGYNYAVNLKHSLVFLMPGVKKFSRKLVKGDAYFDSVTDVLNKIASEPQLLELDDSEENEEAKTKLEEDDDRFVGKRKSHCYLQPRGPSRSTTVMKFTVVDTSSSGGKIINVRELESLKWISRSNSDEVHSELVSSDESDGANTLLLNHKITTTTGKKQKTEFVKKKDLKIASSLNGSDSTCVPDSTRKLTKAKSSRKARQEISGHYTKRRRRLTACSRVERHTDDLTENISSHVGSSSRGSSIDTVEEQQQQQPTQSTNLIDLNYPHVIHDVGNSESVMETVDERDDPGSQKTSVSIVSSEEQTNGVSRRQSTRNRPPTARALEAIANGFLTINTRKKGKKDRTRDPAPRSRNSQCSRGEVGVISECSASSTVKEDDENGQSNGENSTVLRNSRVFPIQEGS